ncbi:hypothetical protein ACS0TY_025954 [Phlomoides rotata]
MRLRHVFLDRDIIPRGVTWKIDRGRWENLKSPPDFLGTRALQRGAVSNLRKNVERSVGVPTPETPFGVLLQVLFNCDVELKRSTLKILLIQCNCSIDISGRSMWLAYKNMWPLCIEFLWSGKIDVKPFITASSDFLSIKSKKPLKPVHMTAMQSSPGRGTK